MAITDVRNESWYETLGIQKKQPEKGVNKELGKDAFLTLMVAQLKNQNPLEPMENSEFVAQLAQFSSVEGIQKLNETVGSMATSFQSSQALQASSLVGRWVKIPTDVAYKGAEGQIAGTVAVPASTSNLQLNIYDKSGELVWSEDLGSQKAGDVSFVWDGVTTSGEVLPAGAYKFEAIAGVNGKPVQLETYLSANVNSVTLGNNNTMVLNVAGFGPVKLSDVKEIL